MRINILIVVLFSALMQVSASSLAQRVTLNKQNVSVQEVLEEIKEQTGYGFIHTSKKLKDRKVSIRVQNIPLREALDECFKDLPFYYSIMDKNVLIKERAHQNVNPSTLLPQHFIQEHEVSGEVRDESGNLLPGVSITIKGTSQGTVTNQQGRYRLSVKEEQAVLVFRFLGFTTQEIRVADQKEISIQLASSVSDLDEVMVIGYGTQKKSDITGSISSIKAADFNEGTNATFDQLLQGKAAGVQVIQNSAEPGGGISVRIRGASSINAGSSPLYVIDGLPLGNESVVTGGGANFDASRSPRNPLAGINPADIESIDVLKDASATAIYGARGANGVVIITTKKGKEGKTAVTYNASIGLQNVAHKIDLLSPQEYGTVLNSLIDAGGGAEVYRIKENEVQATDWQDELFVENAPIQNHSISFTGGNAKNSYYTSFNYFDQKGVVKSSGFKRYSTRLNLVSTISDKLETGVSLNVSYTKDDFSPGGFGINNESGAIYSALNFDPTLPIRGANQVFSLSPYLDMDNPLALVDGSNAVANTYRTFGTVYAKYEIVPHLTAKLNVGGDINSQRRDVYVSRITRVGAPLGGSASILQGMLSNYLVEGTLTYDQKWDKHSANVLVGTTSQRFIRDNTNQSARSFPADVTGTYNIGLGDQSTYRLGSGRVTNKLHSFLGRVNYEFNQKYLLTGSFRMDGSSRFGKNNKYGYFPSVAFGWKMHDEDFLASADYLSNLKPRVSWGQTGNQEIGDYAAISTFSSGPSAILDDEVISTTNPARIANPDLKWETTEQFNIGLDIGLLNERISGSIDYFRKNTFNMLLNLPIPTSTGYTSILSNVGSVKNKGWDFNLNTINLDGDFKWTSAINVSTIKNEVSDLGGIDQIVTGDAGQTSQVFIIKENLPVYSFFGYQIDGIWQTNDDFSKTKDPVNPGDIKYKDLNGDGTVNADDRAILGNSFPKLIWSFGNNFAYKNLSLSVFLEGVEGVKMLNNNLVDAYFPVQFRRNRFAEPYLNRWTPENPSERYPSFINPTGQGSKLVNSYTVEDASYIRIKTITVSYNFPLNKVGFKNLGVSLTGENLFTFTDYSGYDPAVNPNGGAYNRIDFNAYPMAKTFMLGLSVDF